MGTSSKSPPVHYHADGDVLSPTLGILAFKSSPNFEAKGSAAGTNKYKVTIVASDEAGNRSTKNATVNVTNVNEDGSITLSTVQPQVGRADNGYSQRPGRRSRHAHVDLDCWQRAAHGTVDGATKATFTPTNGDTGGTLTVTVSYEDAEGGADDDATIQPIG